MHPFSWACKVLQILSLIIACPDLAVWLYRFISHKYAGLVFLLLQSHVCAHAGMFYLSVRRRLTKKKVSTAQVPAVNRCTDRRNVATELHERRLLKENGLPAVNGIRAEAGVQEDLKSR